jgi:integrase
MSRPRSAVPSYRHHKQSGQAVVTLRGPDGWRRDVLLGRYGSPESKQEYARVIAEWQANGARASGPAPVGLTVAELMAAFWDHAVEHYRKPDGTETSELSNYKLDLRPLKAMYAHTPAADFKPLSLRAVRDHMVGLGWARKSINKHVHRIRRVFDWGASFELVPRSVYLELCSLPALAAGRSAARETEPVRPVADEHIDPILQFLRPQTRAIVQLLRATGMRPGEAVGMRPIDLDRSGPVWLYRPRQHKTAWRELDRGACIGPGGQAILAPFLFGRLPDTFVFSPREAVRSLWDEQRARRRSKVYPSQVRDQAARLEAFGECYTVGQLDLAISRAIEKENARREKWAGEGNYDPVPHWSANQLRHAHGTEVRKLYGLEAAQVALGHECADVTQVYAERNHELARRVAAEIG